MAARPLASACPSGHPYTPENTLLSDGYRRCRTCKTAFNLRYRLADGQPPMNLRKIKQPMGSSVTSNLHGVQRPVNTTPRQQSVRSVVQSWAGRTLSIHVAGDLQRALAVLETNEADLSSHSPHAPRLLHNLRTELARRGA